MGLGPLSLVQIPTLRCRRPGLCPSACSVMGLKCKDLTLERQRQRAQEIGKAVHTSDCPLVLLLQAVPGAKGVAFWGPHETKPYLGTRQLKESRVLICPGLWEVVPMSQSAD